MPFLGVFPFLLTVLLGLLLASCREAPLVTNGLDPFSKKSVNLSTGITMKYVEAGDPAGEAVILLHGYTDTSRSFHPLLQHLTQLRPDLHIFALDQRGHGESSMPSPDDCRGAPERCFRPADFAADVVAFMEERELSRVHLVGHSMGGIAAQEVALTSPRRLRSLVLIGTSGRMRNHPVVKDFLLAGLIEGPWRDALVRKGYAFPAEAYELTPLEVDPDAQTWMAQNWVVDPLADPVFLAAILRETSRIRLGTWIGVARALLEVDNTERLKNLAVPTLVIWATQDNVFLESPDQVAFRAALDEAAEQCSTGYFWKQYGTKPLPASGQQEDDIGHNVQWGAPQAVAIDLAAYLRDGGEPTKDLFYANPDDVGQVLTAPGEAVLVVRPPQNCSP
jgi:non-heme chloroperoxidase